ncbi:MAG TPA: hypothetical protein VK810_04815, partial [Dongiaceae bacterium]|nr:hypothetical protein [Dongiaceae bacterium]
MKLPLKKFLPAVAAFFILTQAFAADFTVVNVGISAYSINGQSNPTLTLRRGTTYIFSVSSTGHPFDIKTNSTTGSADRYNNGVTGQGVTSGNLTFAVPTNAPNSLVYHCEVHAAMTGTINIVNPPAPATLTNAAKLSNKFIFTIVTTASQTNIVQASTNLATTNWISLGTNFPAASSFNFTDSTAPQF